MNKPGTIRAIYEKCRVCCLGKYNYDTLSVVPLEVKSGKNYSEHSALNYFLETKAYNVQKAYVLSNERVISRKGKITYIPIYAMMFL